MPDTTVRSRLVFPIALALIAGAAVFLITSPELLSLGSAPEIGFGVGERVEYAGETWEVVEVNTLHVVPKYLLENVTTGKQTLIECSRIDQANPLPATSR
jgi:hypothetical protein